MCPSLQRRLYLHRYCEVQRRKYDLSFVRLTLIRIKATLPFLFVAVFVVWFLQSNYNYFGPPSARVRGLFVKHTRTGNPLVDSVAEHQPANEQAYQQYLHHIYKIAPYGFGLSVVSFCVSWNEQRSFLVVYAVVAYYFSSKMARLVILLGPVASALGGVAVGFAFDQLVVHAVAALLSRMLGHHDVAAVAGTGGVELTPPADAVTAKNRKAKKGKAGEAGALAELGTAFSGLVSAGNTLCAAPRFGERVPQSLRDGSLLGLAGITYHSPAFCAYASASTSRGRLSPSTKSSPGELGPGTAPLMDPVRSAAVDLAGMRTRSQSLCRNRQLCSKLNSTTERKSS